LIDVDALHRALVTVGGSCFGIDNQCTHCGGFVGEGEVNADWNKWARHASKGHVETGRMVRHDPDPSVMPC
jgi:nitrite reductase/ring-hydroxylating ferredoxin subunit